MSRQAVETDRPRSRSRCSAAPPTAGRVHRVGDTVRRPLRPTSAATHALLRHLEDGRLRRRAARARHRRRRAARCSATSPARPSPRPAPAWGLTDAALRSVGRLLRRFHDAVAGVRPERRTRWPHSPTRPVRRRRHQPQRPEPGQRRLPRRAGRRADRLRPGRARRPAVGRGRRRPAVGAAALTRSTPPTRGGGRELQRLRVLVDAYGLDAGAAGRVLVAAVRGTPRLDVRARPGRGRARGPRLRRLLDAGQPRHARTGPSPGSNGTPTIERSLVE